MAIKSNLFLGGTAIYKLNRCNSHVHFTQLATVFPKRLINNPRPMGNTNSFHDSDLAPRVVIHFSHPAPWSLLCAWAPDAAGFHGCECTGKIWEEPCMVRLADCFSATRQQAPAGRKPAERLFPPNEPFCFSGGTSPAFGAGSGSSATCRRRKPRSPRPSWPRRSG